MNGIPRPPENSLVAEFRRELTQLRDRMNYLLNRLGESGEGDSPGGGQKQQVEKKTTQGLISLVNTMGQSLKIGNLCVVKPKAEL